MGTTFVKTVSLLVALGCGGSAPPVTTFEPERTEPPAPVALAYESDPVTLSPEPERWPEPPRQGERWVAPEDADPVLVATARLLFDELGAPDPRGLERRWAKVFVRHIWGGGREVLLRAWVLPEPVVDGRRFVIAPDGLMYLASVVFEADADVEPEERTRTALQAGAPITEEDTLVALALRLRAGESVQLPPPPEDEWERRRRGEPTPGTAANDWAWARVERAITAHMHGDDPLALRDLTILERLHDDHADAFDARAAGLDSAMPLVADQLRRARERLRDGAPRLPRPDDAPRETSGDVAVRVMALVRELDQVDARQWGQPGGVNLASDPVVQELVAIGDPAVEPLLDVLESDTRKTRSVHFWRDFARSRTVLGVREAAYAALANILQRDFFAVAATGDNLTLRGAEGRRNLVTAIRAYWQRYGALSLTERWYATLEDDHADLQEWAGAAAKIATPSNVSVSRGSMFGTSWVTEASEGETPPLHGESLRDDRSPSVTTLMSRRLATATTMDQHGCGLALAAARWDRDGTRRAVGGARDRCFEASCQCLPDLVTLSADERGVVRRYGRWLAALTPSAEKIGWALRPAAEVDDRSLRRTVERLFRQRPWIEAAIEAFTMADGRPLLALPPIRRALAESLDDCAPFGEITVGEGGSYSFSHENGGGGGSYGDATGAAPAGTVMPLRRCDTLAGQIASASGDPEVDYRLLWPETRRDQALADLKRWLRAPPSDTGST